MAAAAWKAAALAETTGEEEWEADWAEGAEAAELAAAATEKATAGHWEEEAGFEEHPEACWEESLVEVEMEMEVEELVVGETAAEEPVEAPAFLRAAAMAAEATEKTEETAEEGCPEAEAPREATAGTGQAHSEAACGATRLPGCWPLRCATRSPR